ncbi:MAG: LptF/LptG family permease [Rickettsiaceae bacterium]
MLRSAGLSNYAIAKPALLVAVYLTVISYYVSAHLMPISYNLLKLSLSGFRENYISSIIEARTFNQISKYITIYVSKKHSDRSMEGVILFDNKAPDNRTIFFAKNGEIITFDQQRTEFELTEGVRHSYDSSGNLTKLYFDSMVVDVVSDSTNFSNRSKTSLELFIHELLWPSDKVSIEKQSRLIIDGHSRLIWPLFNFIFVFLALSTFLNFSYSRKVNVKQYIYTFIPVIIASYFHFTLQKIAYKDLDYVFLCYANVFICIIFSILQSTRNKI